MPKRDETGIGSSRNRVLSAGVHHVTLTTGLRGQGMELGIPYWRWCHSVAATMTSGTGVTIKLWVCLQRQDQPTLSM